MVLAPGMEKDFPLLQNVQTGSVSHPACLVGTEGWFPRGKSGWRMNWLTRLHLVSRISGAKRHSHICLDSVHINNFTLFEKQPTLGKVSGPRLHGLNLTSGLVVRYLPAKETDWGTVQKLIQKYTLSQRFQGTLMKENAQICSQHRQR